MHGLRSYSPTQSRLFFEQAFFLPRVEHNYFCRMLRQSKPESQLWEAGNCAHN